MLVFLQGRKMKGTGHCKYPAKFSYPWNFLWLFFFSTFIFVKYKILPHNSYFFLQICCYNCFSCLVIRIQPRLADSHFKPHKSHIVSAVENFLSFLQIRYSSPLFRLRTVNAIQVRGMCSSRRNIYDNCDVLWGNKFLNESAGYAEKALFINFMSCVFCFSEPIFHKTL